MHTPPVWYIGESGERKKKADLNLVSTTKLAVQSLPGGPHKETHLRRDVMLHVLFILLSLGLLMLHV